jgi:hypothetical protein
MKKSLIFAIASILLMMISCNNSTQNTDAPYAGEPMLKGNISFTYSDSVGFNDTISIITSLPVQSYRMKGHLAIHISGILDSSVIFLSPEALKGKYPNDTGKYKDSYSRIPINVYPDQVFTQEWKFISDSTKVVNSSLKFGVQFFTYITIDSIYLDMDSLYFPGSLGDEISPIAVPEKKWYDCYFYLRHSEQSILDQKFLLRYFYWWNRKESSYEYFYFKNN